MSKNTCKNKKQVCKKKNIKCKNKKQVCVAAVQYVDLRIGYWVCRKEWVYVPADLAEVLPTGQLYHDVAGGS